MGIGQSSSTPTRRCGEFRWLRHGRRPLLQDPGSWIPAPVASGSFAGSGRQGPGSRVEKRVPGSEGSGPLPLGAHGLKLSFLRVSGAFGGGIRASVARPWPQGPSPWSLGRAPERPWGPGRPRPPGRPKPDPHSGQFPQAHDENSDTIPYGADPGNLPPPKAGKPEMC